MCAMIFHRFLTVLYFEPPRPARRRRVRGAYFHILLLFMGIDRRASPQLLLKLHRYVYYYTHVHAV
jgi:hypothetical protein